MALKVFYLKELSCEDSNFKIALNEFKVMTDLSKTKSPYFIRLLDSSIPRLKNTDFLTADRICHMAFEHAKYGTLFDFVLFKPFTEEIARFYFVQLIKGLHSMHTAGYCHKDIKLENVLLDSNFTLKIAEFGFAQPLRDRNGTALLKECCGTKTYIAPELLKKKPHRGEKVDVFAAGVLLFKMVTGLTPFADAKPKKDYLYCKFCYQKEDYWKDVEAEMRNSALALSADLKSLLNDMLHRNPDMRLSIRDIMKHAWFNKYVPETELVMTFMT